LCAEIGSRVWAVALMKNKKKKQKSQYPYMLTPRGVSTTQRTRTHFGRAGNLPNVITYAKFQIDSNKIVPLAKEWSFMFQHYWGGRH